MTNAGNILLIEDEQPIADVVEYVLSKDGFYVSHAGDGDNALERAREKAFDLVILDINIPGLSGVSLFRALKNIHRNLAIIMLTCRADEVDRVMWLELGADDYVTKPFSPRELAARVRSVLRRCKPRNEEQTVQKCGAFLVDSEALCISYHKTSLDLTVQEFKLLELFLNHPRRVFSREYIIDALYGRDYYISERSIDATVKRLRKKVQLVSGKLNPLETVYGAGYRLHPDVPGSQ
ncbi:MAG: response regulator [Spartobacteria bacterium]|nr:response regulator [Spartobacteria bacterium]